MASPLTRRSFLAATAGLALGAACGGGSEEQQTASPTASTPEKAGQKKIAAVSIVLGSFQPLAGAEQRLAFGVIRGQTPIDASEEVRVAFGKVGGPLGEPVAAERRAKGVEERPLHVAHATFAEPGTYRAVATVGGVKTGEAAFPVIDPATSKVPVPSSPLPSVPTPTTADHRGVEPICTRDPVCPWHDISLDAALAERRPIALLFSTPALCQSAVCGPVLDIVLGLRQEYEGRVRFLHAEIFTDRSGQKTTPALQAFHLENEPFLFFAGADGRVRERFDGPFDAVEAAEALARLVA